MNELRKLDPRLRGILQKMGEKRYLHANEASVLVLAHGRLDEKKLEKAGATHIAKLTENIWSVRLPPNNLRDVHGLSEVAYIEAGRRVFPTLTRSVPSINARREDVGEDVDGRGVVIGIVDYGIDWTLPDFCDDAGRTRIKYLWDQSLAPTGSEKSPQDFAYGVEYGEQDINRALDAFRAGDRAGAQEIVRHRPRPVRGDEVFDTDGHGTHVAGIACGNGASRSAGCIECPGLSGRYTGVAPKAWIVFVSLSRGRILEHIGEPSGSLGNSAELAEAIAYCYRMADALSLEQGKRVGCVVNLSMGFNGGSHDGETLVERLIDTLLEGQGRGLVVAAGNQHQQRTHFAGVVTASAPLELAWKMGLGDTPDPTLNEMEIWYPSNRQLNVRLMDDRKVATEVVKPGGRKLVAIGDGVTGIIDSERFTPMNGDARIYLQVAPGEQRKLSGVWTVELTSAAGGDVEFDAWIEKETGPKFAEDDPRQSKFDGQTLPPGQRYTTLTVPATARRAIAVGATGNLKVALPRTYPQSGVGPTRDGRLKPEVVAPGINICSNRAGFDGGEHAECSQVQMTGTSMSAPHAAGVIALMLQLNPELSAAQIGQILILSAKPTRGHAGFDPQWGFGVLDAKDAVQLVRQATIQSG